MDNFIVKDINVRLKRFGKNLMGDSLFRLVWSDEQHEKRIGTYNEFYGSIFLRTTSGCLEVPKYPYLKKRWVLERWFPPNLVYDLSIPDSVRGSYEPVYVFESGGGGYLEPNWKVVEIVISQIESKAKGFVERKSELEDLDEKKEEGEVQGIEDKIGISPIEFALRNKEAVSLSKKEHENV